MSWLYRLGWGLLALATLAVAASVQLVTLPEPTNAIVLDHATYVSPDGLSREVTLPHTLVHRAGERTGSARYIFHFDLERLPDETLFLLVPAVNRRISVIVDRELLFDSDTNALWSGHVVRGSLLVHLPRVLLRAGRNELTIVLETTQVVVPSYLSKVYVGSEAALAPNFKLRVFLEDRLKTMALAAHVLLGLGILIAYLYRPKDPLFSWLAAMVAVTFILSIRLFAGFQPNIEEALPYIAALSPAIGFLAIGVAFGLIGVRPPRALQAITWLVPGISVLTVVVGILPSRMLGVLINAPILIGGFITATCVVGWGAFRQGSTEARIMLSPFFLITWFVARDAGVTVGLLDGTALLLPYIRPYFLAAVTAVLMRRLALSLDHLDRANENLQLKLAEQEAELEALHRQERIEAAHQVREQERRRLTQDLHDGISGHLVSIIAMSERAADDARPIEQAARAALDDLRLVIYSLDLGDRELPLALANFRERLIPQLQRIGVDLDWSIANLPEVSGVTPGNALTVLRILQEAITNAIKHGPAHRITIRGSASPNGAARITIENDGRPFLAAKTGLGLDNMRRRAHQLQGELYIASLDHGVRLTLSLPLRLPDLQDVGAQ